ncbi:hypothetical protein nbrc107696_23860 [Gordonia spumicola]|uniref:Alpha/beta hydrolase n=1 Tax=Gordonia spumicola TaxID=589161 RepID=A0A7I9VA43_9ACTN|nr:alpha/beta hydrolase [Gordonia spumicola]GEE01940.1 hypothetical protein nbrc107696_23860 [Gordonia spumicola]
MFTSESRVGGLVERDFVLGDVPGILWTPERATGPTPLILLGHPGGLDRMRPRLRGRAATGFACATLELPGSGARPRMPGVDEARADVRATVALGGVVGRDIIERLVTPLVDVAVPEWQAVVDALLDLPEIDGPVGFSGGVTAIAVRLAAIDPRIAAAALFAGSFLPTTTFDDARDLRIPIHVMLQWDDEGNDRQAALDLFEAIASPEKTLHANMGGHTGIPAYEGEAVKRFFERHLHRR